MLEQDKPGLSDGSGFHDFNDRVAHGRFQAGHFWHSLQLPMVAKHWTKWIVWDTGAFGLSFAEDNDKVYESDSYPETNESNLKKKKTFDWGWSCNCENWMFSWYKSSTMNECLFNHIILETFGSQQRCLLQVYPPEQMLEGKLLYTPHWQILCVQWEPARWTTADWLDSSYSGIIYLSIFVCSLDDALHEPQLSNAYTILADRFLCLQSVS